MVHVDGDFVSSNSFMTRLSEIPTHALFEYYELLRSDVFKLFKNMDLIIYEISKRQEVK